MGDSMNPQDWCFGCLLTPGVVSILRRLSPRQALSVSSKIVAPMVYWDPARMGVQLLDFDSSGILIQDVLSALPSTSYLNLLMKIISQSRKVFFLF